MKYLLGDMFRDIIDSAKETGIWPRLSLREKEQLVDHFLQEYLSVIEEAGLAGVSSPSAAEKRQAFWGPDFPG